MQVSSMRAGQLSTQNPVFEALSPGASATNSVSVSTTASVRRVLTTCFLPFLILFPVAQALFDLEAQNNELKADLKDLYINGAQEVDISPSRQAVVIQVPFRLLKAFHKIQQRLVRELEKKFSGKDVVLVANRRINPVPKSGFARARPRSRTLTAVHANLLEDLVYPTEIVGKRQRYRLDGSRLLKVYLDPKDRNTTEYKLDTFAGVYKKMTGKEVTFEFPVAESA
jgi:small subunit ribosomal protein S7e